MVASLLKHIKHQIFSCVYFLNRMTDDVNKAWQKNSSKWKKKKKKKEMSWWFLTVWLTVCKYIYISYTQRLSRRAGLEHIWLLKTKKDFLFFPLCLRPYQPNLLVTYILVSRNQHLWFLDQNSFVMLAQTSREAWYLQPVSCVSPICLRLTPRVPRDALTSIFSTVFSHSRDRLRREGGTALSVVLQQPLQFIFLF